MKHDGRALARVALFFRTAHTTTEAMKILKRFIEKDGSGWVKIQPEEVSRLRSDCADCVDCVDCVDCARARTNTHNASIAQAEDMWHIYHLLSVGDTVEATAIRCEVA